MSATPQFNVGPLLSVKTELVSSLASIVRVLETHTTNDSSSFATALTELHRVQGTLEMLSLKGAVVFCNELAKLLLESSAAPESLTELHRALFQRALTALINYLTMLTAGEPNCTLRLFPEYQALLQARGVEMAFEEDLFFPELNVGLPEKILLPVAAGDVFAHIKSARMRYQQALLKWLRGDYSTDVLQVMQESIHTLLRCAPADASRAFWWVASGLMEGLIHQSIPLDHDIKKLLGRIDQQMKSLLEQRDLDSVAVMNEMLYLLARSHPVSDTVVHIQQVYALEDYLPKQTTSALGVTIEVLGQMDSLLDEAQQVWEAAVQDDIAACTKFSDQAIQLQRLSEQLNRNTLQWLCQQLSDASLKTREPERAQRVAQDMAMTLLLLKSGIANYRYLDSTFHEQSRLINARLQSGLMKRAPDESKLANLISGYCALDQHISSALVAKEIQANLQVVETHLNAFFAEPNQQGELPLIERLLHQSQGGLHLLSFDAAEQLLQKVRLAIERYANSAAPSNAEIHWIAMAVSALARYLHEVELDQPQNASVLNDLLRDAIANLSEPSQLNSANEEIPAAGVSVRTGEEDEELLEVFLEEADEVMEILRDNLDLLHAQPQQREPLVIIRRAFHTLKGSGRMVGLKELGEVAWAVERAMNKWLLTTKTATPTILEMVGDAEVLFQHWIEMLHHGEATATIDTAFLLARAKCIEEGSEVALPEAHQTVPAVVAEIAPTPAKNESPLGAEGVETKPEQVVIGSVCLPAVLFNIATEEAAGHVRALQKQWDTLRTAQPAVIPYDFMRSAHTLAGVNRTMGFVQIAELSLALERWLEERIDKAFVMDHAQLELLQQTINKLDEMCTAVRNLQAPSSQPALIDQLLATSELPPVVTSENAVVELPIKTATPESALALNQALTTKSDELQQRDKAISVPEAEERSVRDEVDEQLLPIFLEEANELYPQISRTLRAWREQAGADIQLGRTLQRSLHTLKGSARMAGAMRLGELTHRVEGRVDSAIAQSKFDDALWNELDSFLDRIANAIELLAGDKVAADEVAITAPQVAPAPQMLGVGAERAIHSALLRVRSDTVDGLVNQAGEVSVARSRVELELREFKSGILELTDSIYRLRQQLREIEIQAEGQIQTRTLSSSAEKFDPLEFDRFTRFQELTRFMNESVHDVQTIQQTLLKNLSETEAALSAQGQVNRELQQGLMAIRMIPFASVSERLYRIVRQTCKELGKRANLELSGTDVELDRSVLEKMTAPFEHLLRNAIAHGLETPAHRERQGKNPIGEIHLSLHQESNEVVFEFSDDGAGLNLTRLKQKALEQGLLRVGEEISEEQALQMIFKPGLSTAEEITEIAGRGVGLDVVRSEISALGGRLDAASMPNKGMKFTIHLPLTLAVTRTLVVRAGKDVYALPATMVEQVQQVKPSELEDIYRTRQMAWQSRSYPLYYLAGLLSDESVEPISRPHNALLLLHSGENRIALHVDELIGNQEVVVKNIGPQLARLPGIAGATVTGNGAVVLIINPIQFAQRIAVARKTSKISSVTEPVHRVPLVMVVDDSLTVRTITSRLLLRMGYQVATAKDGEDALAQLADLSPAVMLLDVEMPRMDGFELTKRLRQDEKTKELPIIMITSRTAEKHRDYALEIGVNEYLGKPYQDEVLMAQITRFAPLSEIDMPL